MDEKKIIWINSHGSFFSLKFDYLLPTTTFFEFEDVFCNFEQKPQTSLKVIKPFKDVYDLSNVLNSLVESMAQFKLENTISKKKDEINISNYFKNIESIMYFDKKDNFLFLNKNIKKTFDSYNTSINYYPIKSNFKDFYRSNKFTKNSVIMSNCSKNKMCNYTNFK